ncbi:MAG TPA: hypothetical protein VE378_03760 [Nitrososphaeraceae archaeon]|nr:hypothetical protein [Nitrososphaeraceae archaeon]
MYSPESRSNKRQNNTKLCRDNNEQAKFTAPIGPKSGLSVYDIRSHK